MSSFKYTVDKPIDITDLVEAYIEEEVRRTAESMRTRKCVTCDHYAGRSAGRIICMKRDHAACGDWISTD